MITATDMVVLRVKKRIFTVILACIAGIACVLGCVLLVNHDSGNGPLTVTGTVSHDTKFDTAQISMTQQDIESAGFMLGDSVDVEFENGYKLTDIPFYNGYYVKTGSPILVAYPGFTEISVTYNNAGIWEPAGLQEGMRVTIRLNTQGKYLNVQEVLGQQYSLDRNEYESDEQFCNFRALSGGKLKRDFLFRGASPVDNSRGRAHYTDALLEEHNVRFVIDLADSETDMASYIADSDYSSEYVKSLYMIQRVALLGMGSGYQTEAYHEQVVNGLRQMMKAGECPVYIHCMEGKDRTGFVCVLLEALAGASYDEMLNDYMITYSNYYRVTADGTPEKYDAIADLYFNSFAEYLHGSNDIEVLKRADYAEDASEYLLAGGMSTEEIAELINRIAQ